MKLRLYSSLNCLGVVASLGLLAPGVAVAAGTFSPPVTLGVMPNSSNVSLGSPAAAIDGAGTAAVAFDLETLPGSPPPNVMQVRTAPLGGSWSATTKLSFPGTLVANGPLISVEGGEAGPLSVLFETSSGIISSDRISGNTWAPGVVARSTFTSGVFESNREGDQLIVTRSAVPGYRQNIPVNILAQFRRGGAAWGTDEIVGTGNNAAVGLAALAPNGSAVAVWNTSVRKCARYCQTTNVVRHISTRAAGTAPWVDVGALPATIATTEIFDVQADAAGNVVFLIAASDGTGAAIIYRNGEWSAPASAIADQIRGYYGEAPVMRLDGAGHATFAVAVPGLPQRQFPWQFLDCRG